jgi:hypothetical protein
MREGEICRICGCRYDFRTGQDCRPISFIICDYCTSERQATQQPEAPNERSQEALGSSGNVPRDVVSEKERE